MRRTPARAQLSPQRVGRSSSVISGTSLRHDPCFRAVTIADARAVVVGRRWRFSGCGHDRVTLALGRCGWLRFARLLQAGGFRTYLSGPAFSQTGRRPPFPTTTAGPVISASFRPFRFGGGL